MSPYVNKIEIQNFGCLGNVKIPLTPLHCFIGPNDSGKSSLLRALQVFSLAISHQAYTVPSLVEPEFRELKGYALDNPVVIGVESAGCFGQLAVEGQKVDWTFGKGTLDEHRANVLAPGLVIKAKTVPEEMTQAVGSARMLWLNPESLKSSSELIPEGEAIRLFDVKGTGLPGVYDAIINRDVESFQKIVAEVRKLFPTVEKVQLRNVSTREKVIAVELNTGQRVPAEYMSTGLLYFLAFAALPYLEPASILLIEEPENGLHPARIQEIMRILREVSKTTQVLIATHSPLVVNELTPEEVSVVTRDPVQGTKVRAIKEAPNFTERSKVYALGELWVSYANGQDEAPLFEPSGSV